jgi:predicted TIM-barrel fold metal-dependent hydrolase
MRVGEGERPLPATNALKRRSFVKSAAALMLAPAVEPMFSAIGPPAPVIDAHIHLFDPTRRGGVPWPDKSDVTLYRPALPARYQPLAGSHGIVGAIAIECSPWLVDNFWLQEVAERNPMMLGFIGDLLPESSDFGATLDRLHRSPLFLGIRYGNLWNRDLQDAVQKTEFLSGLKILAQAGLVFETANPDSRLIAAVLQLTDHVPNLRIVIDHLPHAEPPADAAARSAYEANLRELSTRPSIYVKGSEIVRHTSDRVSLDVGHYKASLDRLWDLFGEERIFFGSDWPNSDSLATFDETFSVARGYISTRRLRAQDAYFWKNSISVYRWRARTPAQARLLNA